MATIKKAEKKEELEEQAKKWHHVLRQQGVTVGRSIWNNKQRIVGGCLLFFATFIFGTTYQISRISGDSMNPSLKNEEIVLVNKRQVPQRYDVVAFAKEDEFLVKRVIGVPGDRFLQSGERLLLDTGDNHFEAAYSLTLSVEVATELAVATIIPDGYFFVVGDNAEHSLDSRFVGLIPESAIHGIVTGKLF